MITSILVILLTILLSFSVSAFGIGPEQNDYSSNPEYDIYTLDYMSYRYLIPYEITGSSVRQITLDCASLSLYVNLGQSNTGKLTIDIPRKMLDTRMENQDADFIVLVDDLGVQFYEETNVDSRTLSIPFVKNSKTVEIISTWDLSDPNAVTCGLGDPNSSYYYKLLSPIKQSKLGVTPENIVCKNDQVLIKRMSSSLTNCVTYQKADDLHRYNKAAILVSLNDGINEFKRGDYDKASRIFSWLPLSNPNDVNVLKMAGDTMIKRGHAGTGALYYYKKWLELEPENTDAMIVTAVAYKNMGRVIQSNEIFKQVLLHDENNEEALKHLSEYDQQVTIGTYFLNGTLKSYPIEYSIYGGAISNIKVNAPTKSILILFESFVDGQLEISFPKELFDSQSDNHDEFIVLVDDEEADFEEVTNDSSTNMTIIFSKGSTQIEVISTWYP